MHAKYLLLKSNMSQNIFRYACKKKLGISKHLKCGPFQTLWDFYSQHWNRDEAVIELWHNQALSSWQIWIQLKIQDWRFFICHMPHAPWNHSHDCVSSKENKDIK